jgi:hypothetical protein
MYGCMGFPVPSNSVCRFVCRFDREDPFFIRAIAGANAEAPWPSKEREAGPRWYAKKI